MSTSIYYQNAPYCYRFKGPTLVSRKKRSALMAYLALITLKIKPKQYIKKGGYMMHCGQGGGDLGSECTIREIEGLGFRDRCSLPLNPTRIVDWFIGKQGMTQIVRLITSRIKRTSAVLDVDRITRIGETKSPIRASLVVRRLLSLKLSR